MGGGKKKEREKRYVGMMRKEVWGEKRGCNSVVGGDVG